MRTSGSGRRLATAAVIAAATIGATSPAQADLSSAGKPDRCEGGDQRLEQRFREIEAKRGWEAASKWWNKAWERYYERCLAP